MKKVLLALLLMCGAFAVEVETPVKIMPSADGEECDISQDFTTSISNQVFTELGLEGKGFQNLTSTRCWTRDNGQSIYMEFMVKDSASDIEGQRVSVSIYANEAEDLGVVFSAEEERVVGYTLKNKYVDYLQEGKDVSVYVSIQPVYEEGADCNALEDVFGNLQGEKYWNEYRSNCNIVTKIAISEIRDYVMDGVGGINYFGTELKYQFQGKATGEYNLRALRSSIDCEFGGDYYDRGLNNCHGTYQEDSRIHFSANKEIGDSYAYINIYGFEGGRGRVSANVRGEDAQDVKNDAEDFFEDITTQFFGEDLTPTLEGTDADMLPKGMTSVRGEADITTLDMDMDAFDELDVEINQMNTYYSGDKIHATFSKPYIRVYISEDREVVDELKSYVSSGDSVVITEDAVFSQVVLDEDDPKAAKEALEELTSDYVKTEGWEVERHVTGGNYVFRAGQETTSTDISEQHPELDELEGSSSELLENFLGMLQEILSALRVK